MDRPDGPSLLDGALGARPAERPEAIGAPGPSARIDQWIGLAAALTVHAAILSPLLLGYAWTPDAAPPMREIPVEIVVEPSPQPTAPQRQLDLEPARDAPRAGNNEKIALDAPDATTKSLRSPTREEPGAGATPAETAATKRDRAPDADRTATPTAPLADGGPLQAGEGPADVAQERTEADAAASPSNRLAMLIGQPFPTWSKGKPFSTFDPPSDVAFSGAAERSESPISGAARKTYLTVLYGMIMSHLRLTEGTRVEAAGREGEIAFVVDSHGAIVARSVARPSGSRDLDAAALEAVTEAAPFPTPPTGLPVSLRFTYGAK